MSCLELKLVLIRICSRTVLYLRSFNLSTLVDYVCAGFMICVCFSDAISCSFISPYFYVFVLVVKLLVHLYWCWNKVTFSISGNLTSEAFILFMIFISIVSPSKHFEDKFFFRVGKFQYFVFIARWMSGIVGGCKIEWWERYLKFITFMFF